MHRRNDALLRKFCPGLFCGWLILAVAAASSTTAIPPLPVNPCCDSLSNVLQDVVELGDKICQGVDTLVQNSHDKGPNYPLVSDQSSLFFTVMFGILGILIGLMAIIRSSDIIFDQMRTYRDGWLLGIPLTTHFAIQVLLGVGVSGVTLVCFLNGLDGGVWYSSGLVIWVGSFLHLMTRLFYFTMREW